jgi:hypothetical protein
MITLALRLHPLAAEACGSLQPTLDVAVTAHRAGIDRVVAFDHMVFGERLEEDGPSPPGVEAMADADGTSVEALQLEVCRG